MNGSHLLERLLLDVASKVYCFVALAVESSQLWSMNHTSIHALFLEILCTFSKENSLRQCNLVLEHFLPRVHHIFIWKNLQLLSMCLEASTSSTGSSTNSICPVNRRSIFLQSIGDQNPTTLHSATVIVQMSQVGWTFTSLHPLFSTYNQKDRSSAGVSGPF